MKRNVDLSELQMFTTPEPLTGLAKLIYDAVKVTKPWDFENNPQQLTSDLDLVVIAEQRHIFAVGDKKERQNWKQNHAYDTDQICDRCGQKRGKKPWAKNRCNCYSMVFTPKIPWKF